MSSIPPLAQILSDDLVGLRWTAERDIPEILIAYQDDPRLHVRLGKRRPPSGAELGQELDAAPEERAKGIRANLAILELPADVCRGELTIHGIDWENKRALLGIWLAPRARGRGLARRALGLAARWLFDAWGLERVAMLTDPGNEAMLRAAKAAGFVQEGVLRSFNRSRDGRCDLALLSLLPSDLESLEMAVQAMPESRA